MAMSRSPARMWMMVLGVVLLLVAVLGLVKAIVDVFHGMTFHLEGGENGLHWILGILSLVLAFAVKDDRTLGQIVMGYGVVYLLVGIFGFFVPDLSGLWHVGIADNILHLALGVVTFLTGRASAQGMLTRTA